MFHPGHRREAQNAGPGRPQRERQSVLGERTEAFAEETQRSRPLDSARNVGFRIIAGKSGFKLLRSFLDG